MTLLRTSAAVCSVRWTKLGTALVEVDVIIGSQMGGSAKKRCVDDDGESELTDVIRAEIQLVLPYFPKRQSHRGTFRYTAPAGGVGPSLHEVDVSDFFLGLDPMYITLFFSFLLLSTY